MPPSGRRRRFARPRVRRCCHRLLGDNSMVWRSGHHARCGAEAAERPPVAKAAPRPVRRGGRVHRHAAPNSLAYYWRLIRSQWAARLPLVPDNFQLDPDRVPALRRRELHMSWLQRVPGPDFRVRCIVCAARGHTYEISERQKRRIGNVLVHQASAVHGAHLVDYLNQDVGPNGKSLAGSPSAEEFHQVWDAIAGGRAAASGVQKVAQRHKVEKMMWLLVEALFTLHRKVVGQAESIALMRDESRGCMIVRISCVTGQLHQLRTTLGMCRGHGTGAAAVTEATRRIIKTFCTKNVGAPSRGSGGEAGPPAEEFDEALFKRMLRWSTTPPQTNCCSAGE